MKQELYNFAESRAGLLFLGFLFTTIVGTAFNQMYQKQAWERELRTELLKRSLEKHEILVNELSALTSGRAFRLERVVWAIENHVDENRVVTKEELETINNRWTDYYANVIDWNENFRVFFSKLRYIVGKKASMSFYAGEAESRKETDTSLYSAFRNAHLAVLILYRCSTTPTCAEHKMLLSTAREKRDYLNDKIDEYLLELQIQLNDRVLEMREI